MCVSESSTNYNYHETITHTHPNNLLILGYKEPKLIKYVIIMVKHGYNLYPKMNKEINNVNIFGKLLPKKKFQKIVLRISPAKVQDY